MTKNQENWFALEITVDSEASKPSSLPLNELDALGTELTSRKKQTETFASSVILTNGKTRKLCNAILKRCDLRL